ncbi:uncharacterized [Tachysurus ichikawai]
MKELHTGYMLISSHPDVLSRLKHPSRSSMCARAPSGCPASIIPSSELAKASNPLKIWRNAFDIPFGGFHMRLASRIIRMARVFPSLQTGAVARSSHRRFRGAIRAPPQHEHVEDIRYPRVSVPPS